MLGVGPKHVSLPTLTLSALDYQYGSATAMMIGKVDFVRSLLLDRT
jgi:hypothetical protein